MKAGVAPRVDGDLSALRSVGATGSPLSPEAFQWVYDFVGVDVWLFSMSGGTDVCTAFVGGVPTLPVHRGEIQARALGARVEAWDEHGRSLVDEVGELVLTAPMPSMPVFSGVTATAGDYARATSMCTPGVWRHGDWMSTSTAGCRCSLSSATA
jgi:acetoacetyl-CoA synthetase